MNPLTENTLPNTTHKTSIQTWWSDWKWGRQPGLHQDRPLLPESELWSERMTIAKMQHIPLASAYLCQDCNCIGNCASHCPACASEVLLNLAGVLDRQSEVKIKRNCIQQMAEAAA